MKRGDLMRRVRQSRTDIEDCVAERLRAVGARYRRNVKSLPGSPDFAHKGEGWAIFVNGCFWHFHRGCRLSKNPAANVAFWTAKRTANRERDAAKIRALRALGFKVMVVWQCELSNDAAVQQRLSKVREPRSVQIGHALDCTLVGNDVTGGRSRWCGDQRHS